MYWNADVLYDFLCLKLLFLAPRMNKFLLISEASNVMVCCYLGVMAGSPCPIEVMKQVVDELHMPEITVRFLSELL